MSIEKKIGLASPVSERVQLVSVLLVEHLSRRGALREDLPKNISISTKVRTLVNKVERIVEVRPHHVMTASYGDEAKDRFLHIEAGFALIYQIPSFDGLKKSNFDAFGEMNGLYNVWPYWREFVQATTVRMGLPALTVPVYRPIIEARATKTSKPRTRPTKSRPVARASK